MHTRKAVPQSSTPIHAHQPTSLPTEETKHYFDHAYVKNTENSRFVDPYAVAQIIRIK